VSKCYYVRRIWAYEISFFVSYARDVSHPGSGSAQSLLRICLGWLTFAHPMYHFRQAAPQPANPFNSSRGGPELLPYIKVAKMPPTAYNRPSPLLYLILVKQATSFHSSHCVRHCLPDPLVSSVNIRCDIFIDSGTAL